MRASIQSTVRPRGYTGQDFNKWQKQLQKAIDKVKRTTLADKLN